MILLEDTILHGINSLFCDLDQGGYDFTIMSVCLFIY